MKWTNRKIFGIRYIELIVLFFFYFFFASFYYVTLWLNRAGYDNESDVLLSIKKFMDSGGLQYVVFFFFTIPIWLLIFRVLKKRSIILRLALHIILLPIFAYGTRYVYYMISEALDWGHLSGTGQIWDIYIPALFYLIQFGVFHAYEYFLENQRKIKLEAELRNMALKSELSAIKAQLNPHFLYNTFNTISASVPHEQEKTRHLIAELSDLFRYQLKASQEELVPLKEEIEFVSKYLNLEKERFQERLKIRWEVGDNVLNELVPPMILQPLVENSVKHGLSSLINGGEISIVINKMFDKLAFEISDTGLGIKNKEQAFNTGIGLKNTKLRLEKMYDSTLRLIDNKPNGLTVSFEI